MMVDMVINALATGIGAGFGSYFGSKMAMRTEHHLKKVFGGKNNEGGNLSKS